MLKRIAWSVGVWVIVALALWLLGGLLLHVAEPTTHAIGGFLKAQAGLIGFLCGLVYFFFGDHTVRRV